MRVALSQALQTEQLQQLRHACRTLRPPHFFTLRPNAMFLNTVMFLNNA